MHKKLGFVFALLIFGALILGFSGKVEGPVKYQTYNIARFKMELGTIKDYENFQNAKIVFPELFK